MSKTIAALCLVAGASAQIAGVDYTNWMLLDRFSGYRGNNLPLLAATGVVPQDQILPFMAMDSFNHGYNRFSQQLPMLAATGAISSEQLPMMMLAGDRHGSGFGGRAFPLMAAGLLEQDQMANFMMMDRFGGYHGNGMLPLISSGIIPQDQMLPFMAMSGELGHGSMPLLAATGAIPQDQMLPFMAMSGEFGHGDSMLPLLATGAIGQDQMLPFMAMNGEFGRDSMLPLLATGAIPQDQMLPFMMMDRFSGHRGYAPRHYGRRAHRAGARRVVQQPVAPATSASGSNDQ
jgi:hypothetical protein